MNGNIYQWTKYQHDTSIVGIPTEFLVPDTKELQFRVYKLELEFQMHVPNQNQQSNVVQKQCYDDSPMTLADTVSKLP